MIKIIALIFVILTISTASFLQPRDLVDEAQEQLEQLQQIVQGEITVAHNTIESLLTTFKAKTANLTNHGYESLKTLDNVIISQFKTIQKLAQSDGKDISSCIEGPEKTLNNLPAMYKEDMRFCIAEVSRLANVASDDARYFVDVVINNVHNLEFQLKQCRGDLLCISPILSEIELDKIRLPQNINTEVQSTETLMNKMNLSVKKCSDDVMTRYSGEAWKILRDVEKCADKIIDGF